MTTTSPSEGVVRSTWGTTARKALAELLLTAALLFLVVTMVRWIVGPSPVSDHLHGVHLKVAIVGALVALVLPVLILSPLGRRSGGHMNPAITIAMWRYRVFPGNAVIPYVLAQLAGSVIGVSLGRLAWGPVASHVPVLDAALQPAAGWSFWQLFVVETLTMATIIVLTGLVLSTRRLSASAPYAIGLIVGVTIAGLGPVTGGSANPARQLGPALVSGQSRFLWAYLLAPVAGALLAALIHDLSGWRRPRTHALCGVKTATESKPTHEDTRDDELQRV